MFALIPLLGLAQVNFDQVSNTGDLIPQFYGSTYWNGNLLLVSGYSEYTINNDESQSNIYSVNSLGACALEPSPGQGVSRGFYLSYPGQNGENFIEVGRNNSGTIIGIIHIADGSGNYTQQSIIPLEESQGVLFDWDNDGDLDLVYQGEDSSGSNHLMGYENINGIMTLSFNEVTNACYEGDIVVGDTDNDGDLDFLVTGWNDTLGDQDSILHRNDGGGNFTPLFNVFNGAQPDVQWSSTVFLNLNGDSNIDLVIMGWRGGSEVINQSYIGNGNNTFSYLEDLPILTDHGDAFGDDVDGDGDDDLYLLGMDNVTGSRVTQLYINDGTGHLTLSNQNLTPHVHYGMFAVIDFNSDGKKDLFIMGDNGSIPFSNPQFGVYMNTSGSSTTFTHYYDGDGDGTGDPSDFVINENPNPPVGYVSNNLDTHPNDPCLPFQNPGYNQYNGDNQIWRDADCDSDNHLNGTEYDLGTDPYDPNDFPLSISDNLLDKVIVFPNPTDGILNIQDTNQIIEIISIFDSLGRLLFQTDTVELVDLSNFSDGLYLVRLSEKGSDKTFKIIKQ